MATHFVIIGDSPARQSGLGRICGDLWNWLQWDDGEQVALPIDHFRPILLGHPGPEAMRDLEHWGALDLLSYAACIPQSDRLIVFTVYDPARCFSIAQAVGDLRKVRPVELWGYFAVDAEGPYANGAFGGPAAAALLSYNRVLAYGEFGARVLHATMARGPHPEGCGCGQDTPPTHLPHGLDPLWFNVDYDHMTEFDEWTADWIIAQQEAKRPIIGCVAANQPRKDWGSIALALRALNQAGLDFAFWAHTDRKSTSAWNFSELAAVSGLGDERFMLTGGDATDDLREGGGGLSDQQLAFLYRSCKFTVAPGLGEGFGYPIVESAACGVPCLGIDYAGGAPWLTHAIYPESWRHEGAYLLKRPVIRASTWAVFMKDMLGKIGAHRHLDVPPLAWPNLWPRWRTWLLEGLNR